MTRQALVIHNENSRRGEALDVEALLADLTGIGYEAQYLDGEDAAELTARLAGHSGLVLVIGGDGTIRSVGLQLLSRQDVELAVIPAGTANNIALSLGLGLQLAGLREALADSVVVPFDVGRLRGVLGEHYFLESCGFGVIADMMAAYNPDEGKSVLRALRTMIELLPSYEGHDCELRIDGRHEAGKYVMVEALNTRSIGPRLQLAPDAATGDGLLELLRINDSDRHGFIEYARQMRAERLDELENVTVDSVRQIEFAWSGFALHVDDEVIGNDAAAAGHEGAGGMLSIDLLPAALRFRVPRAAAEAQGEVAAAAELPRDGSNG